MWRHPYFVLCSAFVLVWVVFAGLVFGVAWIMLNCEDWAAGGKIALDVLRWLFIFSTGAVALAALWRAAADTFSPRAAPWIAGLAAVGFAAILVHGLASGDARGFGTTFGPWAGMSIPVWLVCTALCGGGAALWKRNWRILAVLLRAAGWFVAFCVAWVLVAGWFSVAPFCAGVRSESVGEPLREVVLSRAWCGWWKGFDLRLYARRAGDGRWQAWSFGYWPYALGECVVEFRDDGVPMAKPKAGWGFHFLGERPRDKGAGRDGEPGPLGGEPDYSGDLSPDELHVLHQGLCRQPGRENFDSPDHPRRHLDGREQEIRVDEGWRVLGVGDAVAGEGGAAAGAQAQMQ